MGSGASTVEGAEFPTGRPITGGSGGPIGMGSGIGGVTAASLICGGIADGSSQSSSPVLFVPLCPLSRTIKYGDLLCIRAAEATPSREISHTTAATII
jgi:hypothetical protein